MKFGIQPQTQTERVLFNNDRDVAIRFGIEPEGWYLEVPPRGRVEVIYSYKRNDTLRPIVTMSDDQDGVPLYQSEMSVLADAMFLNGTKGF